MDSGGASLCRFLVFSVSRLAPVLLNERSIGLSTYKAATAPAVHQKRSRSHAPLLLPAERTPMFVYLGLSSRAAQVQSVSADCVTLLSDLSYSPGSKMTVELVNDARSFKCLLSLRVARIQPHPGGGFSVDAEFSRRLTTDELMDLLS